VHEAELGKFYTTKSKDLFRNFRTAKPDRVLSVNIMIVDYTLSFYTYANPAILYVVKSHIVAESYKAVLRSAVGNVTRLIRTYVTDSYDR